MAIDSKHLVDPELLPLGSAAYDRTCATADPNPFAGDARRDGLAALRRSLGWP